MVCNPDDFTLKYVYALLGGEYASALGAKGAKRGVAVRKVSMLYTFSMAKSVRRRVYTNRVLA